MQDIFTFLKDHDITYECEEHAAVFTCDDANEAFPDDSRGVRSKNLFLRDKNGKRHFLVVLDFKKSVDLKALADALGASKLSFASPERLKEHLGVEPGSVSLMGLVHDTDHCVEVIIDEYAWNAKAILCHPLVNTATLVIPHADVEKFLEATGHKAMIIDVPERV